MYSQNLQFHWRYILKQFQIVSIYKTTHTYTIFFLFTFIQFIRNKTEVPRDVQNSKVLKQRKLGRDWSQHKTHASPKEGHDKVSGGVSVICWHATPVTKLMFYGTSRSEVKRQIR